MDVFKSWPRPFGLLYIKSLLGLAGHDKRSIDGFYLTDPPFMTLTWKKAKFIWYKKFEKSFWEFNDRLTSSMVFTLT